MQKFLRKGIGINRCSGLKKALAEHEEAYSAAVSEVSEIISEANFLITKFHDGTYADVPGFCRIADRAEIVEKGYSLTPGKDWRF